MNFFQFCVFDVVVCEGSFICVVECLCISQLVVIGYVKVFEEYYQVILFWCIVWCIELIEEGLCLVVIMCILFVLEEEVEVLFDVN